MSTPHFVKYLHIVRPPRDFSKDLQLLDEDESGNPLASSPIYGITTRDVHNPKQKLKTARIIEYASPERNGGEERLLAEIQWVGDQKDRIRIASPDYRDTPTDTKASAGEWMLLRSAWDHYSITKDRERFISKFIGRSGGTYVWVLEGSVKVLKEGSRNGPILAKHLDEGTSGGRLALTEAALSDVGDMLYISFLSSEGFRRRRRFDWAYFGWG
ncbi:hypothetical protein CPB86DRAFT_780023 [Serendipita vermifera]|nr:hypothetical protein CPB86DRAFT_780023 [Serendipita vermifera]